MSVDILGQAGLGPYTEESSVMWVWGAVSWASSDCGEREHGGGWGGCWKSTLGAEVWGLPACTSAHSLASGLLSLFPTHSARPATFNSPLCCRLEAPSSGPGSCTPVQLNCPALWELPSTSVGSWSLFLHIPRVTVLYFGKDPYSLVLQTPGKMSYFLLKAELCPPPKYICWSPNKYQMNHSKPYGNKS